MINYQHKDNLNKHKSVKFERKRKTGLQIVIENIQGENKVINKVKNEISETNVVENNVVESKVVENKVVESKVAENNVVKNNVVESKFQKAKKKIKNIKRYHKPVIKTINGCNKLFIKRYKYRNIPELNKFISDSNIKSSNQKFLGIIPFYWWSPSKIKWSPVNKDIDGNFEATYQTTFSDLLQIELIFGIPQWELKLTKIGKNEPVSLDLLYDTFFEIYPDFIDEPINFIPIYKKKNFHIYIANFGHWDRKNKIRENINNNKLQSTYCTLSQVEERKCDIFEGIYYHLYLYISRQKSIKIEGCTWEIDFLTIITKLFGYYQLDFSFKKRKSLFQFKKNLFKK